MYPPRICHVKSTGVRASCTHTVDTVSIRLQLWWEGSVQWFCKELFGDNLKRQFSCFWSYSKCKEVRNAELCQVGLVLLYLLLPCGRDPRWMVCAWFQLLKCALVTSLWQCANTMVCLTMVLQWNMSLYTHCVIPPHMHIKSSKPSCTLVNAYTRTTSHFHLGYEISMKVAYEPIVNRSQVTLGLMGMFMATKTFQLR